MITELDIQLKIIKDIENQCDALIESIIQHDDNYDAKEFWQSIGIGKVKAFLYMYEFNLITKNQIKEGETKNEN